MPPSQPHASPTRWRLCVDTGGTFTDCLAIDPQGREHRAKVLSSGALRAGVAEVESPSRFRLEGPWISTPAFAVGARLRPSPDSGAATEIRTMDTRGWVDIDPPLEPVARGQAVEISTGEEAPILAARLVTGAAPGRTLPPMELRLATTRGTNALLERHGAPVAFFVTEGLADLLLIGDQTRPELFTLRVRRPRPLYRSVVEVRERLGAGGEVVVPLDLDRLRADARAAVASGLRVGAVALAHAWTNGAHERAVGEILAEAGFEHVSLSSALGASIGLLARAETAVINAFLAPVVGRYLDAVERPLGEGSDLRVMTSAGGLVDRAGFEPKDSLLSGPAGGVIGAAAAGRLAGFERIISFDMGGTSTDCARCEGLPERLYQTRVGDARIVAPAVAVETVAAGGGSVCSIDRAELRVGPESAGADPGPACYGRGGPLTLTDCNLLLGRLDPARFALPLDRRGAMERALEVLASATAALTGPMSLDELLTGFIDIADQRMSEAVRRITLRRGHDPAEHALVAFGGAGPQHACAVADALGIDTILVPPDAGLLSARGLFTAELERVAQRQILRPLGHALPLLPGMLEDLTQEARAALGVAHDPHATVRVRRSTDLQFCGETDLFELEASDLPSLADRFLQRYRATFGHVPDGEIELVAARVTAALGVPGRFATPAPHRAPCSSLPGRTASVVLGSRERREAAIRDRSTLAPGEAIEGPALLTEAHSTIFVEAGWRAAVDAEGSVVLVRAAVRGARAARGAPVEVELAAGKLGAIALEMGERLRRTAISVNIKERHDFSCAILDAQGRLIVNAPHVPVHLGSMGVCVRAVRDMLGPSLGGTVVTNHPAFGGSHLPDVTVIEPVLDGSGAPLAYAACRAHHAEIGGIAPGSMAPGATCLAEEGVVIPPTVLGTRESLDWEAATRLFTQGPHPSRSASTNARDLAAAIHAAWAGADALSALAHELGPDGFRALGEVITARAASRVRAALLARGDGAWSHEDALDDGTPLRVRVEISGGRARVDFTGSGPVHPRCLNATPAIVTSAVMYVLRLLIDEPLPLNEGLLDPVDLRIPPGVLNPAFAHNPRECPAVAGGNVEISQLVVETMLSALGECAQSQGTMNNVVFGDSSFGFYETLGGGSGAALGWRGESAIHTHMTNTFVTDPELLEFRAPVRLERCAIRRASGGDGHWAGGDGMERVYRFLRTLDVSVLAERRARRPGGLLGGKPGMPGSQTLLHANGTVAVEGFVEGRIEAAQALRVLTPGGGGYGAPQDVYANSLRIFYGREPTERK